MASSSNKGLLIGCLAVGLLGGGCVVTAGAGAAAWFLLGSAEVSPPIAVPTVGTPPPVVAPIAPVAPVPATPIAVAPVPVAPIPAEVAPVIAPTPEPPAVMHLTSVPDGARVSEGGVALGTTPLDVPVAPRGGSRTLRLEADGYNFSDVTIYDTPGSQQITLQAARPSTASTESTASARSGSGSAGSGSSGSRTASSSGSSGSGSSGSGSRTGSSGSGSSDRGVASSIRPAGGGSGSGTTTTTTPRAGTLSHDDF